MKTESLAHNPFMLMLSPEAVLAAVERSEKLGRLNRRLCHPLDRPQPLTPDGQPRTQPQDMPLDD
ncbi:MAG: hypothetical protein H6933_11305 [Burkholderiaceae bacterium]|nr:hypothetical protein [Burkholderiaceae bacterium]